MKLILLSQWFDPEPTFKGLIFAKELVRYGFDITVITGFPNYPGGKIYEGYQIKIIQREMIDGVKIIRLPLYPSHDNSAINRILNYCSFSLSALIYGLFFMSKADVMYAYHPPLTVGIVASIIKKFRGIPLVYDIQDIWPDSLRVSGMLSNEILLGLVNTLCNWVYSNVDAIVVLSPGFKKLLISRGVNESKINVIYNWCDELSIPEKVNKDCKYSNKKEYFEIMFAGNIGKAQALTSILQAAKFLEINQSKIKFVFLGSGIEKDNLIRMSTDLHLKNVEFKNRVPMAEVWQLLKSADVLLVHLQSNPLFNVTIPSKIQAYMAIGKPILVAIQGDAADLILTANCGIVAIPENPKSIALAVEKLLSYSDQDLILMGRNGADYYRENMSLSVGVASFSKLLKKTANAHA